MPKVKRAALPTHVVVVDTSFLWHQDKSLAISNEFTDFWLTQKQVVTLELAVPEVVFGELHFQQATSARKLSEKIAEQMTELAAITQGSFAHSESFEKIKERVEKKLQKALGRLGASVVPTPVETADWRALIARAIWKDPPFSFDPKNPNFEKGFRDSLILETLCSIEIASSNQRIVVFLSKDALLLEAAEARLISSRTFQAFASFEEFNSYLSLAQKASTEQFVKGIQGHAKLKFYKLEDKQSLLMREKIPESIERDFAGDLLFDVVPPPLEHPDGNRPSVRWQVISTRWTVGATQFKELQGDREFHWSTKMTNARMFERRLEGLPIAPIPIVRTIATASFDVLWKAQVKADGRFMQSEIVGITFHEKGLLTASPENATRWNLILPPQFNWT